MITIRRCDVRVQLPHPWSPISPNALAEHVLTLVVDALIPRLAGRLDESRPVLPRLSVRVRPGVGALAALNPQADPRRRQTPDGGRVLPVGLNLAVHDAVDVALYELYAQPLHERTATDFSETLAAAADRAAERVAFEDWDASVDARTVCLRTLRRGLRGGWLTELLRAVGPLVVARWATLIGVVASRIPDDTASAASEAAASAIRGSSAEPFEPRLLDKQESVGLLKSLPGAPTPLAQEPPEDLEQYYARPPSAGPWSRFTARPPRRDVAVPVTPPFLQAAALDRSALEDRHALTTGPAGSFPADRVAETKPSDPAQPVEAATDIAQPDDELNAIRMAIATEVHSHGPIPPVHPVGTTASPPWRGEVHLTTVLPFLLLRPLQWIGALDALAAVLTAQGQPDGMATFAAALARKVLPPPDHGWHQPAVIVDTIAAVAGRPRPPDGTESQRLAATAPAWSPVLHRLLRDNLAVERLVRATGPQGVTLADADGVFPLAVDPADLGHLPVTEDRGPLRDFVAEMAERPASGRGDLAPGLDTPMNLIVGFVLADVAWRLWHHREPTHPLLALDRFADLDGHAEFTADRVVVRLPLGRRHADLLEHGMLASVPDIPWFGGRPLELTGG